MAVIRTTIYLEDKDRRALKVLQERYGLATLSDAIRFSIRIVQGLAPPESALAHHLPVRGQRRSRGTSTREVLTTTLDAVQKNLARAHTAVEQTRQILRHSKELRHHHCALPERQAEQQARPPGGLPASPTAENSPSPSKPLSAGEGSPQRKETA